MARKTINAPTDPTAEQIARLRKLAGKGGKRTPAEASEAIDILSARVDALEASLRLQVPPAPQP